MHAMRMKRAMVNFHASELIDFILLSRLDLDDSDTCSSFTDFKGIAARAGTRGDKTSEGERSNHCQARDKISGSVCGYG